MEAIIASGFLGAWAGFFAWGKHRKWTLTASIGGGFIGACLLLMVALPIMNYAGESSDKMISGCADAIDTLHLPAAEHNKLVTEKCDSLSHESQKRAAELATKKSGAIVFIPPYEAK